MLQMVREEQWMVGRGRSNLQDSHPEAKPEVLLPQYPDSIGVPSVLINIVAVSQHDKHPG